jgi:hypothetical protein
MRDGRLTPLLRVHAAPPMPVHLVHADAPLIPLKLRAFLDFAAPRLSSALKAAAEI